MADRTSSCSRTSEVPPTSRFILHGPRRTNKTSTLYLARSAGDALAERGRWKEARAWYELVFKVPELWHELPSGKHVWNETQCSMMTRPERDRLVAILDKLAEAYGQLGSLDALRELQRRRRMFDELRFPPIENLGADEMGVVSCQKEGPDSWLPDLLLSKESIPDRLQLRRNSRNVPGKARIARSAADRPDALSPARIARRDSRGSP